MRPSGEYLIQRLVALGARHVFGVPGDYVLGFYDQLQHSPLRIVNLLGAGRGFVVETEGQLDQALFAAERHQESFYLLDVRLAPWTARPLSNASPTVWPGGCETPPARDQGTRPPSRAAARRPTTDLTAFQLKVTADEAWRQSSQLVRRPNFTF